MDCCAHLFSGDTDALPARLFLCQADLLESRNEPYAVNDNPRKIFERLCKGDGQ